MKKGQSDNKGAERPFWAGKMSTILVVEDDISIQNVISQCLERDGHEVLKAGDGETAIRLFERGVDLVIMDVMIPHPDGLELTRRIRATSPVPILIISARAEEADRVTGLELGADDYLTKPFATREMLARVKALLRRARLPSVESIAGAEIVIDLRARSVKLDGQRVELTAQEFDLIKALASVPGKSFTRDELLDAVWGEEYTGESRRVDNGISRLRHKLRRSGKPDPIRSIWGVGYRLEL